MSLNNIVAIIGRPNIGKSTLFNRLTKSKNAIVADEYGVTRDRKYQPVDWAGKTFTLVDTGGLVPDSDEFFESRIRLQVEIAIQEADSIIFLLDVTTGITAVDMDIANNLKKARKKVTVVINKVDNDRRELDVTEFYNLGLGEPIGISGLNGRNIGNMLDLATENIAEDGGVIEEDPRMKIAIIGKPNVGKSSLVNSFLDSEKMIVSEIAGTTRDSVDSVFHYRNEEIVLIDTAGLRRKKKIKDDIEYYSLVRTMRAIDRCDVAILMIDATEGVTKQDIDILMEAERLQKGVILASNKWDLVEDKETNTAKQYKEEIFVQIPWMKYVPVKFISVIGKQRLLKLVDLALQVRENMKFRISTSKLNDYLLPIMKKTTPASVNSRFVKIKFVTQVATDPPVIAFFVNEPDLLKDNYKRFLEKKIRAQYGFQGVPLKLLFKRKSAPKSEQ